MDKAVPVPFCCCLWHPGMMDDAPAVGLVLAAVDASAAAVETVEVAAAVAARYGAALHVVHMLGGTDIDGLTSGALDPATVAADGAAIEQTAQTIAADAGVAVATSVTAGFSTASKLRHPGSVVCDTADQVAADLIVLPREPLTGAPGEVLEKAAEYVLLYASQPVISV